MINFFIKSPIDLKTGKLALEPTPRQSNAWLLENYENQDPCDKDSM